MTNLNVRQDTNFRVTIEQIGRLERALLAMREASEGAPDTLDAIAAIQYQEIARLRSELDAAMGFAEEPCDLVVSLQGPNVRVGVAPVRVVAETLNNIHGAIQAVFLYLTTGRLRSRGRLPDMLSRTTDFQFVGTSSGSVRIKLNLPESQSLFPEYDREPVERSARLMLQAVEWVSSSTHVSEFERRIEDEHLTRLLLSQVRRVAPPVNGIVQRVEFSGRLAGPESSYTLSSSSASRIRDAFSAVATGTAKVAEEGRLRSVDLDNGLFQLRQRPNDQPDLRCFIPSAIMTDALAYMLEDTSVILEGGLDYDKLGLPYRLNVENIYEVGADV